MKLFDIDWANFIDRLTVWERLSLKARKAFAGLKSNQGIEVTKFDGHAPELAAAGLLSYYVDCRRARLYKEGYPFSRTIRAMVRNDIFGRPDENTLRSYLRDTFTAQECDAFTPRSRHYYYDVNGHLLQQIGSVKWLGRPPLVSSRDARERHGDPRKPLPDQSSVVEVVRSVIGEFKTFLEPIAFRDLAGQFPTLSAELLGTVILVGIRSLFLFPAMRPDDMTPVIGLWPTITHRLHRPKVDKPNRVEPDQTYHSALLMEDMTSILVAAMAWPLRIRANDGTLFAKARAEVEATLVSAPDWVAKLDGYSPSARIDAAFRLLQALKYVRKAGKAGKDLSLQASGRGTDWLTRSGKDRLKAVLDQLKPGKPRKAMKRQSSFEDGYNDFNPEYDSYDHVPPLDLISGSVQIRGGSDWNTLAEVSRAFDTIRGDGFVLTEKFLQWHGQEANPLLQLPEDESPLEFRIGWSRYQPTDEQMEIIWRNMLEEFALTRLFPLGGLRMGTVGVHGDSCISLTDAGRYLLDLVEDFDYGHEHETDSPVLIQPNFDVVFTSPSPQAEASIGRFAQRKGRRVGTLFKITKGSIFAAASTGITAEQVLDTLRDTSSKAVPANVEREIRGWFDQCRQVTVRQAILVHCPDAHTGVRVLSAGGKKATAITDTLIELPGSKRDAALFRKLAAMGIFVDSSKPLAK